MTAPLVDIADLVIGYDTGTRQVRALDGASLQVGEDETLAIVGESGSGKTTLGMAAGRLLPPEAQVISGNIHVASIDVTRADDAALRRLRVGPFTEVMAVSLDSAAALGQEDAASSPLLPVETALADIPALALTGGEASRLSSGQALSLVSFLGRVPHDADPDGGIVRVMAGGKALAIGRLEGGMLHPVRMLTAAA